ncbi:MAG: polysaccharide biosynthesis protein, partial [Comamonadaceae bacterium]
MKTLLGLPRPAKRTLVMGVDVVLCVVSVWLAFCLRLEQWHVVQGRQWWAVAAAPALALPMFVRLGLYRTIFRYAGAPALLAVSQASLLFGVVYAGLFTVAGISGVPRSVGILAPV